MKDSTINLGGTLEIGPIYQASIAPFVNSHMDGFVNVDIKEMQKLLKNVSRKVQKFVCNFAKLTIFLKLKDLLYYFFINLDISCLLFFIRHIQSEKTK